MSHKNVSSMNHSLKQKAVSQTVRSAVATHQRKNMFFKTKVCPWYSRGMCIKMDECCYAHTDGELRGEIDLRKTSFCHVFRSKGSCANGQNCQFAHSAEELRPLPPTMRPSGSSSSTAAVPPGAPTRGQSYATTTAPSTPSASDSQARRSRIMQQQGVSVAANANGHAGMHLSPSSERATPRASLGSAQLHQNIVSKRPSFTLPANNNTNNASHASRALAAAVATDVDAAPAPAYDVEEPTVDAPVAAPHSSSSSRHLVVQLNRPGIASPYPALPSPYDNNNINHQQNDININNGVQAPLSAQTFSSSVGCLAEPCPVTAATAPGSDVPFTASLSNESAATSSTPPAGPVAHGFAPFPIADPVALLHQMQQQMAAAAAAIETNPAAGLAAAAAPVINPALLAQQIQLLTFLQQQQQQQLMAAAAVAAAAAASASVSTPPSSQPGSPSSSARSLPLLTTAAPLPGYSLQALQQAHQQATAMQQMHNMHCLMQQQLHGQMFARQQAAVAAHHHQMQQQQQRLSASSCSNMPPRCSDVTASSADNVNNIHALELPSGCGAVRQQSAGAAQLDGGLAPATPVTGVSSSSGSSRRKRRAVTAAMRG